MNYDAYAIEESVPELVAPLKRLSSILDCIDEPPRVTVLGKYNHGKSSLLNSLMDNEYFNVADKRETREIKKFESNGIQWIDAPGLGADLDENDDDKAHQAASDHADILMLVHAVNAGELDRDECQLFAKILRQDYCPSAKAVVVLTRVDQLSPEDLAAAIAAIEAQLPGVRIFETSSARYRKSKETGKSAFLKKSGIEQLRSYLNELGRDVMDIRGREALRIIRKMRSDLCDLKGYEESEVLALNLKRKALVTQMGLDFSRLMHKSADNVAGSSPICSVINEFMKSR